MRKSRILSLLLAVAVMATMLVAVPLTASAAQSTYDFKSLISDFSTTQPSSDSETKTKTITESDITIDLLAARWYVNTGYGGLTSIDNPVGHESSAAQGEPTNKVPASGNVIKLKFAQNGKVKMDVRINNARDTFVCEFPTGDSNGTVLLKEVAGTHTADDINITISFNVQTGKDYYVYTHASKLTYKNITFTPEGEEESPYSITASYKKAYVGAPVNLEVKGLVGDIKWSVNDQKGSVEADSNDNAKATFKGTSTGTITVTASAGSASATCDIEVLSVPTPTTVEEGGADKLEVAETTTTYDLLDKFYTQLDPNAAASEVAAYNGGNLYFNKQIAAAGTSNLYYSNRTSYKIDGAKDARGGIRVKTTQDMFALKLASGSIVKVDIAGGGSGDRYGVITKLADYKDGDKNKGEYLVKSENIGSSNGKLDGNHQLLTYENKSEIDETIYITATGDSFISQIQVIVPDKEHFGTGTTDSGKYSGSDGTDKGVIRFLQSYVGQGEVKSYGIYFINSKGDVEKATIKGGSEALDKGIIADLYDIENNDANTYSAMAYVEIGDQIIWSKPISGQVNWTNSINYPEPVQQP